MKILGIETSCDDTTAAVVDSGVKILSNIISSQSFMHERYGGIIPEISSREHLTSIIPVVNEALNEASITADQLDVVSVTYGPGLAGSLLVGVNVAKGLALSWDKPLLGINHLEGHIYAGWLEGVFKKANTGFPLVCLIASGGHTEIVLMKGHLDYQVVARTRDDAAGEAFDKVARVLGLGFPGGPEIQREAEGANHEMDPFPRPSIKGSLDFSFSGLKTAVVRRAESEGFYPPNQGVAPSSKQVREYSAAFQEAIVDCLVSRTISAVEQYDAKGILIGGGVAANSKLKRMMHQMSHIPIIVPRPSLCTDNGAMIAAAAFHRLKELDVSQWDLDAIPNLSLT